MAAARSTAGAGVAAVSALSSPMPTAVGGYGGSADRTQNVKVAVRIRPFNKREKSLGSGEEG
jgi:hypothetical protein